MVLGWAIKSHDKLVGNYGGTKDSQWYSQHDTFLGKANYQNNSIQICDICLQGVCAWISHIYQDELQLNSLSCVLQSLGECIKNELIYNYMLIT